MKHHWNTSSSTEFYFKMPINILCQNPPLLNILSVEKTQLLFPISCFMVGLSINRDIY